MSLSKRSIATSSRSKSPKTKLIGNNIQNKENVLKSSNHSKSMIYEPPKQSLAQQCRAPMSLIDQMDKVSERSFEESIKRQSSIVQNKTETLIKKSTTQGNSKNKNYLLVGCLAFILISFTLAISWQGNQLNGLSQEQIDNLKLKQDLMLAQVIARSIQKSVVFDNKSVNIQKEKNELKQFYKEEFTNQLWELISKFVSSDERIREKIENEESYWSI